VTENKPGLSSFGGKFLARARFFATAEVGLVPLRAEPSSFNINFDQ